MSRSLHGTHQVEPSRFLRAFPFPALAVLLFLADVFFYPPTTAASAAFLAMMCVALGFAGRFPRLSSASFLILLFACLAAPHELASIGLSALGVYAVAALWICKGWYVAAALALEKERSHALLAEAREATAQLLHDTAAAHLIRAIAAQEQTLAATHDPRLRDYLDTSLEATRAAMRDLRVIIDAAPAPSPDPDTLRQTILDSQRLLASHAIALDTELDETLTGELSTENHALLLTLLREGCVNVFKHAPSNSTASLTLEAIDDHGTTHLDATLINEIGAPAATEASSGLGLAGLARQAAFLGAKVETHIIGTRWILSARIPLDRREDEER